MGQYRSKNKPYANVELNVTGRGDKKKGSGSASLKVKKGKTKVKVNLGGGFQKTRPVEGVDVENYGLTKGLDFPLFSIFLNSLKFFLASFLIIFFHFINSSYVLPKITN